MTGSAKCPACGVPLKVQLFATTDYTKTKQILESKASGADLTNEQLSTQHWKQSTKREALSTILVDGTSLAIPILKLLYDKLAASPNKSCKLAEITYKLSRNDEGTEWLQRWRPVEGAAA